MAATSTIQTPIVDALMGGACLTTAALAEAAGLPHPSVAQACSRLVSRGWIVRRERGCFELSSTGRAAVERGETITSGSHGPRTETEPRRPRRRTGRDRMWTAMRTLQKFSLDELETLGGASRGDAQRYTLVLLKAGYLVRLRPAAGTAPTSNGFGRYLLIRNSGPTAPVYRAGKDDVWDRNEARAYPIEVTP